MPPREQSFQATSYQTTLYICSTLAVFNDNICQSNAAFSERNENQYTAMLHFDGVLHLNLLICNVLDVANASVKKINHFNIATDNCCIEFTLYCNQLPFFHYTYTINISKR